MMTLSPAIEGEAGAVLLVDVTGQVAQQPGHVDLAVASPGVPGVAPEVVQAVHVEIRADELTHQRAQIDASVHEEVIGDGHVGRHQRGHMLRGEGEVVSDALTQRRVDQDRDRVVLVRGALVEPICHLRGSVGAHLEPQQGGHPELSGMGEGGVPHVVAEGGQAHDVAVRAAPLLAREWVISETTVEGSPSEMHHAEAVCVARVGCPGEGQLGETELANSPQALEEGRFDDGELVTVHLDGPVQGTPDLEGGRRWAVHHRLQSEPIAPRGGGLAVV